MKVFRILFALAVVFALAAPLIAQNANQCPGDKEYQFNIIGMNAESKNVYHGVRITKFYEKLRNTKVYETTKS